MTKNSFVAEVTFNIRSRIRNLLLEIYCFRLIIINILLVAYY